MKTKEAIERVKARFDKWALDEEDLAALQALGLVDTESEDEKIRKELIDFVSDIKRIAESGRAAALPYEDIELCGQFLAYLEKQKEQKPVKLNDDTEVGLDRALLIVKAARGNLSGYQTDDGVYECDHAIQTLERILKNGIKQQPAEWSEEDEKKIGRLRSVVNQLASYTDSLDVNGDYCEGDYAELDTWLKSLPERFNLPPKQEWSEEDEQFLLVCKNALNKYQRSDHWDANIISNWLEERLKSLRPQHITYVLDAPLGYDKDLNPIYPPINHWKPSEEQMKALDAVSKKGVLLDLFNDLLKLF